MGMKFGFNGVSFKLFKSFYRYKLGNNRVKVVKGDFWFS